MTITEIKRMLLGNQYDFLRTDKHLNGRIILLTLGGSYAYGTNVETSDVDVRGCALNSVSDILGLSNFEQVIDEKTDTVIYSFNKLVRLLINCNPNVIELLGCKPEHYLFIHPLGQQLIDHKNLFLSKKVVQSFGGYANQQMRKLQNGLSSKKDMAHLNKHAMHLVRLYLMCLDILEKEQIITYRENDLGLLMDIRNGAFQNDDGTYRQEFFDLAESLEKQLSYAKANTSLPDKPKVKEIEEFVISVNRKSI